MITPKVALLCDYLIERDHYVETLEKLCEIFELASIYTFVHNQGHILGRIEERNIYSTQLSHITYNEEDYFKKAYMIPHLAKSGFHVDCDTDLVISLSRGFAHGIKVPDSAKHICLLYDLPKKYPGISNKILGGYTKKWMPESFKGIDQVFYLNPKDKEQILEWTDGKAQDLIPPFKISDYPPIPDGVEREEYFVVNTDGVNKEVISYLKKLSKKIIFIGKDTHLQKYKTISNFEFWGVRCSGDQQLLFAKAKGSLDFSKDVFPSFALSSLACQCPVWCLKDSNAASYISKDHLRLFEDMNELSSEIETNSNYSYDKALRLNALKYGDGKMKIKLKKSVESLITELSL